MPVNAAGMRIDPPPSEPMLSAAMPVAAATAAPPDEPPGVISGFQGLRVTPVRSEWVTPFQPISGVVVLPRRTATESLSRAAAGAFSSQGWSGSTVRDPRKVGQPRARTRSLTVAGTPSTGQIGRAHV